MKHSSVLQTFCQAVISLIILCCSLKVYAQEQRMIDSEGLKGEELVSIAVHPGNKDVVFLGTGKGLHKKNLKTDDAWKRAEGLLEGECRVNQILIKSAKTQGYVATSKGVYSLLLDSGDCQSLFHRADELERDCLSVCALDDGSLFAGTKGGLFVKRNHKDWLKVNSPFDKEEIIYLYGEGSIIYVAGSSGVYKSSDSGKRWEKVFNVYSYREVAEDEHAESDSSQSEEEPSPVKHITGLSGNQAVLYVATSYGIFKTEDSGKNWTRLPQAGLDLAVLKFVLIASFPERVFAVTKTGVYELKNEAWKTVAVGYDCRQVAKTDPSLVLITSRDIFLSRLTDDMDKKLNVLTEDDVLKLFCHEPSISQVQKMAVEYAEVSDEKIKDWRRRANVKAFLPQFSLDYDKTVTTALGATYDRTQIGPRDWGVSLKWELSELVFNPDQTSIDNRSKLMVQLRNDILAEATRIYFERRKLQIDLVSKRSLSPEAELEKKLRLMELTALLDRLTGGHFSQQTNSR